MEKVRFLQIEPTSRCNFTCGFCVGRTLTQNDLPLALFDSVIEAFADLQHVELQGEGESLMHPAFLDMVERLRKKSIKVSFISNGSCFSAETNARLLELGVEKISISMESARPEEFKRIRGGKLEKVISNVEALMQERRARGLDRPIVGIGVTVLKSTRDALPEILTLYERLGLDAGVTMHPLQRMESYTNAYRQEMQKEALSAQESDDVWVQLTSDRRVQALNRRKSKVKGFYDDLLSGWRPGSRRCPWLQSGLYINRDGEATACCQIKDTKKYSLGKIGVDAPAQILERRARLRDQLRAGKVPEACVGCDLAKGATMSWREIARVAATIVWRRIFGPPQRAPARV